MRSNSSAIQCESAVWRNFYLVGAHELRNELLSFGKSDLGGLATAMTTEMLFDAIGVRLLPDRLEGVAGAVNWHLIDRGERHVAGISNRTLFHTPGAQIDDADATVQCNIADLIGIADGGFDTSGLQIEGDDALVAQIAAAVDTFERIFPIVTP